jgi:MinD superfamily P-loop ATPase
MLVDCDVDASDLHLLLSPVTREKNDFISGVTARVRQDDCNGCGTCMDICHYDAISMDSVAHVEPLSCEGCAVCAHFCPENAIDLEPNHCGYWYVSDTEYGPMVHARLIPGEENSGKLVSLVKREARERAEGLSKDIILVDGPPGIGCPVIASISGADMILVVTEPTQSGLHDLERVIGLCRHFKIKACACINKWELNRELAEEVEKACERLNVPVVGRIPFDTAMVESLVQGIPVVKYKDCGASKSIANIWSAIQKKLNQEE